MDKDKQAAHREARSLIQSALAESIATKQAVSEHSTDTIAAIARKCAEALARGSKILLCGNGGSAADAQHLAAEFLVRLNSFGNRQALPALSLATDVSTMTACSNDYGFDRLYERMVEALGRKGDVLIGISTSGNSENIVRALKRARANGLNTVGLLGADGGAALELCDVALLVPSQSTSRVQESHITVGHIVVQLVEVYLRELGLLSVEQGASINQPS